MTLLATNARPKKSHVDIKEYNHLRSRILYNAPALHSSSPRILHHGYTVVSTSSAIAGGTEYQASLIAFTGPGESTQNILLRKSAPKQNLLEALQHLLHGMEHDLGILLNKTTPGSVIGHSRKNVPETFDADKTPTPATYAAGRAREMGPPPTFALPSSRSSLSTSKKSHRQNASLDISAEYLRSQGFAPSVISPTKYHAYRKPVSPTKEGYQAYNPSKPDQG